MLTPASAPPILTETGRRLPRLQSQVQVLRAKLAQALALHDRSEAIERRAALELDYTTITAPIDGVVGARTIRLGQYVQAGTQLTALVPLREVYIMANFKETQLKNVRAGEPVRVRADTFPGTVVMIAMLWYALERAPRRYDLLAAGDWLGIFTMALGLGCLETVLGRQQGRLVRLAVHPAPCRGGGRKFGGVHLRGAEEFGSAIESAIG